MVSFVVVVLLDAWFGVFECDLECCFGWRGAGGLGNSGLTEEALFEAGCRAFDPEVCCTGTGEGDGEVVVYEQAAGAG